MKIGCCISIQNIAYAKAFGYDFVELSAIEIMAIDEVTWRNTKKKIQEANIPVLGFNAFCDEHHPLIGPNYDQAQLNNYLDTLLLRASELHCQNIGIGAPKARNLPKGFSYDTALTQMKTFLKEASTKASNYAIQILYEAINPKECNFGNTTNEIYDIVKELQLPNLNMVWDVFHAVIAGEQYQMVANIFDAIKHVHICSWDQALHRYYLLAKDQDYVTELIQFLKDHQYDNSISIEANDCTFQVDGKSSIEMIHHALTNAIEK